MSIEKNESKEYHCNINGEPVVANKIILKVWSIEKGRSERKPFDTIENDIVHFIKERNNVSLSLLYKNISGKNSSIENKRKVLLTIEQEIRDYIHHNLNYDIRKDKSREWVKTHSLEPIHESINSISSPS